MQIEPIATFRSPFPSKFGIPKQSGLVPSLRGRVVFQPKYRNPDALRGLDGFDYVWLIWGFSANPHAAASPVVRPPVLGGNERVGVFATRSPFRPNGMGLSSVRIESIEETLAEGMVINVLGADLMDGTPVYDIKPYIAYADSHPDARCGFAGTRRQGKRLRVSVPSEIERQLPQDRLRQLKEVLSLDPRPSYHNDPTKTYGMPFYDRDVHFRVDGETVFVISL